MKKAVVLIVIGFLVVYAVSTSFHGNKSAGDAGGAGANPQAVTASQSTGTNFQVPPPTADEGKSSAYYAALVNQYQSKVQEEQQSVDFLQNNFDKDVSKGTGYISDQLTLDSAKQLLETTQQILAKYKAEYNQARAEGR